MRWPFAYSSLVDALRDSVADWKREAERLRADRDGWADAMIAERARYDQLLEHYHSPKLIGAHEPTPVPPPPPHALAKYPKTRAALDAMGHGQQGSVRRAMTAEAVKMLTVEGLSDEFVAKAVAQGEPYQPREDIT